MVCISPDFTSISFHPVQICLHSCFQNSMVKTCGCAQYAQPLPAGAEFCNYKKYPNWSKSSQEVRGSFTGMNLRLLGSGFRAVFSTS